MNHEFEYIKINDWTTIKISGPQILEYLNGIVTYDLEKVKLNQTVRNMFLTPKAKIRSLFWATWKEDGLYLFCPTVFRQNLIEDLLKYKLEMNVKLEDISEETDPLYLKYKDKGDVLLGNSTYTFVNLPQTPQGKIVTGEELDSWMIKRGDLPYSNYLDQNPYEIGANDAVTLEKGCFLGQEPLSRMFHRGKPRKYVIHIKIGAITDSEELKQNGETVGEIISMQIKGDTMSGLAYINSSVANFTNITLDNHKIEVIGKVGKYPNISR